MNLVPLFDRKVYFDNVRHAPFSGHMSQTQVNGQKVLLKTWEMFHHREDLRWLANMLAQTFHETAQEMLPIEEYGQGAGQPYGEIDEETGQGYWGRGFVQVTWRENYEKTDKALMLNESECTVWHADHMMWPRIAARAMYYGMRDGWFRSDEEGPQTLPRYFNDSVDDPYGSREIINGDKTYIPDWSEGTTIGELIAGYHCDFLAALKLSVLEQPCKP